MSPRGARASHALAIVLGMAIGFATPLPSRAAEARSARQPVWSSAVAHGPLAVAADRRGAIVTTNLGDVIAFDRAGSARWTASVSNNPEPPALSGDLVLVGGDETIHAFDRASGVERWEQPVASRPWALALGAEVALAGDDTGALRAFDATTGRPRWSVAYPGAVLVAPVVDEVEGLVIATWTDARPAIRVLDLASGALRWEQEIDYFTAAPVVHAGRVLIAEGDGHFHAVVLSLDVATGELRWGTQVRASFESEIVPAVDDRAFVVVDHYGHVTALDPSDGSVLWERSLDQTVLGTRVALTDRRVTLSTAEWDVFTLDRANGRIVRRITAARLGGYAVDLTPAPFSRDDRRGRRDPARRS